MSRSFSNHGNQGNEDPNSYRCEANNIYIKNIPDDFNEDDFLKLFAPYGHIKSHCMKDNELGKFGFICYEDPDRRDLDDYGPRCARRAIKALNGRRFFNNYIHNKKLYVGPAMKKEDR